MKLTYFLCMLSPLLFIACNFGKNHFELQNGDLLFSVGNGNSELLTAIQNSTSTKNEIPFSHVGIVLTDSQQTYVVEATSPEGVVKTPLDVFFEKSASLDGKKLIAVGRLKFKYRNIAATAPLFAEKQLGRQYDYAYDETNNAFYCSELVRYAFIDSTGAPVFEPLSMSFKNKETGETDAYWMEHFRKLNVPVPEGMPGTNPVDLAKSDKLEIVYTYY